MMDTFVSRAFAISSMQLWREKLREIYDDVMQTEGARAWPMQFVLFFYQYNKKKQHFFATVLSSSSSVDNTRRTSPLPRVSTFIYLTWQGFFLGLLSHTGSALILILETTKTWKSGLLDGLASFPDHTEEEE